MGGNRVYKNGFIKRVILKEDYYVVVFTRDGENYDRPVPFAKTRDTKRFLTRILHEEPEVVAKKGDINIPTEFIYVIWEDNVYPTEFWGIYHEGKRYHFSTVFDIYCLGE